MTRSLAAMLALCAILAGCSDSNAKPDSPATSVVAGAYPIVGEIDAAIAALEAELGEPQEYFEINATPQLINLFVALDNATSVQAWLYIDGELTSDDPEPAEGGTLRAVDIAFEPSTIFSALQRELPSASVESFYIHGDGQGSVQYRALLTTAQGGAIEVQLAANGDIISSDALN